MYKIKEYNISFMDTDIVIIIDGEHKTYHQNEKYWLLGNIDKNDIISSFKTVRYTPPWAFIVFSKENGIKISTDYLGLQHIFYAKWKKKFYISNNPLNIAGKIPFHLDSAAVYDLFVSGNPQSNRSIYKEIKRVPAASLLYFQDHEIIIKSGIKGMRYNPEHSPVIVDEFIEELLNCVSKNSENSDYLELTGGRDSMLIFSSLIKLKKDFLPWTFGTKDNIDVKMAKDRSRNYNKQHLFVDTSHFKEITDREFIKLLKEYVQISGGMSNPLEYWSLPQIINNCSTKNSISGCGGETFRGMYYRWVGYNIPFTLGKYIMYRGKHREMMPFRNKILKKKIFKNVDKKNKLEFLSKVNFKNNIFHNLDLFYLQNRARDFVGTNFTISNKYYNVKAPLYDFSLVRFIEKVPVKFRKKSKFVNLVIDQVLEKNDENKTSNYSNLSKKRSITKIFNRLKSQMCGTYLRAGQKEIPYRYLVENKYLYNYLKEDFYTQDLYNTKILFRLLDNSGQNKNKNIPLYLGTIFALEETIRQNPDNYRGIL